MNAQASERQWFEDIVEHNRSIMPDMSLAWLNETREAAKHAIASIALPNRKQEAWRYSDLARLYKQTYQLQDVAVSTLDDGDIETWVYSDQQSHRLVFANGCFVPGMSTTHALPDNIIIGSLRELLSTNPEQVARWLLAEAWYTPDVFTKLNHALIHDGLVIHVPENTRIDKPIEVVYINIANQHNALVQPRSLVILAAGARAKLVERYTGSGESAYFFNGTTDIFLGANTHLKHYRLQNESSSAHHLSHVSLRQDTASEYRGVNVSTGGAWSRTDINTRFDGEHASCELDGLYTVGEQQYTDFHLNVQHSLAHCRSREDFKGIVYGKGRAVFDGNIQVERDAQKTDAHLSNNNLLLVENAEVDTKPQLVIHADDVKCSHGTTVGRLDPDQLFYLRSRGIDEHEARKMICLGFAEQVLSHVEDENVHSFFQERIADIFNRREVLI